MGLNSLLSRLESDVATPETSVEVADVSVTSLICMEEPSETSETSNFDVTQKSYNVPHESTAEVVAAPLFAVRHYRLTVQSASTQYEGFECMCCRELTTKLQVATQGGRRLFQWTCKLGHRPLCAGYGGERVMVAPPECQMNNVPNSMGR